MPKISTYSVFLLTLGMVHTRVGVYVNNKPGKLLHELMKTTELMDVFGVTNLLEVPEYEIFLPKRKIIIPEIPESKYPDDVIFRIEAFNQTITLLLQCNKKLISEETQVVNKWKGHEYNLNSTIPPCHYMGTVDGHKNTIVAMSTCNKVLRGTITFPDIVYHIAPVPTRLRGSLSSYKKGTPHIILKNDMQAYRKKSIMTCAVSDNCSNCPMNPDLLDININLREIGLKDKKIKVGVFFDDVAVKEFQLLGLNDKGLREFILAFMNQVNLIYHHPSLGIKLDVTVVYLEIMHDRPVDLPSHDGDVEALHQSFKTYQASKNGPTQRWDHAIYLTGIDFWNKEKDGTINKYVTGFADHSNMCNIRSSSIIEIGLVDPNTRQGLSGGFGASYTVAHEIGHSLGMLHDGPGIPNTCPANGFIMTSSRGLETEWSTCSKSYLAGSLGDFKCLEDSPDISKLDPSLMFKNSQQPPGQIYDADDQCRIQAKDMTYLRRNAWNDICSNLECWRPEDRLTFIYTGPALSGTFCGEGKWCQEAHCVSWGNVTLERVTTPNWSIYISGHCMSGCLEKSIGVVTSWRFCVSPRPKNSESTCIGEPKMVKMCSDQNICTQKLSVKDYINKKCLDMLTTYPNIEIQAHGSQLKHNYDNEETACTVYCKTSSGVGSRGIDQLPDGSWCHNDGQNNFYCQNKKCRQIKK